MRVLLPFTVRYTPYIRTLNIKMDLKYETDESCKACERILVSVSFFVPLVVFFPWSEEISYPLARCSP